MERWCFIFYGYFLKGTGSAIFARELTRALNNAGINVVLFSQEDEPHLLDFISEAFNVDLERNSVERIFSRPAKYRGKTYHFRHDTKKFLPVYVYDSYPQYQKVKTFSEISSEELVFYSSCVRDSVKTVMNVFDFRPSAVIYHHLVPFPSILGDMFNDESILQAAVFHGSDLNFAIRKSVLMEKEFKRSLKWIDYLITLTDAGKNEVLSFLGAESSIEVQVIHPGIDFTVFFPRRGRQEALSELQGKFVLDSQEKALDLKRKALIKRLKSVDEHEKLRKIIEEIERIEAFKIPESESISILKQVSERPVVLFAGKYLWTKGIAALLLSMPYVWKKFPDAILLLVGFGSSRGFLEKERQLLSNRRINEVANLIINHRKIDPGSKEELILDVPEIFARKLQDERFESEFKTLSDFKKFEDNVYFLGYFDHKKLAPLMSFADVFVAPSLFKESFGLVLVEASASGTVPVASCHSGFKDILSSLSSGLGLSKEMLCVKLDDNFVPGLAQAIIKAIKLSKSNASLKKELYDWTHANFSWSSAAEKLRSLLNL